MILLSLVGCGDIDLSPEWELDRLRLLAIRAEPAEPAPGDTVTFSSLTYVPDDAEWSAVWIACVLGADMGCDIDPSVLESLDGLDEMTPEELAEALAALTEAGFIGFEPFTTPAWTVPADALDGLTDAEALEGVSATVQVTMSAGEDTELVLKRLPVSRATTPNTNPDVGTLTVDELALAPGTALVVETGQRYELEAALAGELEEYEYVTTEGVAETRTEELEWRWYASAGDFEYDIGGGDDDDTARSTTTWVAPDGAQELVLHAVVLDGRGGMGWWSLPVTVE